jgi:tRNA U34 5-carboxymethylaminomethyl modifying GTPase MnmE/TrmE
VLLDAETIDVNRGCDGVIIVHDPSRPETLAYSLGLLKDIKEESPVILVANFADVRAFAKTKELTTAVKKRERCASASACSKDGFGVDLVRDFLTVPFLAIKQRYAQRQLNSAKELMVSTRNKLDTYGDTLNFAAHCQQWNAGGAAMAAQQAQRMQQARQSAVGVPSSDAPETPKVCILLPICHACVLLLRCAL